MGRCRVVLADLRNVPDTCALTACTDAETTAHIETVRLRLLRRRRFLLERKDKVGQPHGCGLGNVVAGLRRLQNPQLAAFHRACGSVVLSEPFKSMPSAIVPASLGAARRILCAMMSVPPPPGLVRVLAPFGEPALAAARSKGVSIALLGQAERFADFSAAVARCLPGVDAWIAPPAGLFVVEERRLLLRGQALRMTAAHEFAHALDAVLALRHKSYFSFESEEVRHYYSTATGFINEYAATGLDEYFAESVRAYVEINDPACTWLPLTRRELFVRDPRMFGLIERVFRTEISTRCSA